MPATFPSHAAAVLPVKLRWPHRFDGVALVVGSCAPDAAYAVGGFFAIPRTHRPIDLVWFALPVTVLVSWLVRWAAPMAAAHLPRRPAALALRDYGVLGQVRHRWYVTVWSALLGATSHLAWDALTHGPQGQGYAVRILPWLGEPGPGGEPWWVAAQHMSTVVGAAVALGLAVRIGRHRLLRVWHGEAPAPVVYAPRTFWGIVVVVCALYPATWPVLPAGGHAPVAGVRMLWTAVLATLAGVVAVRLLGRRQRSQRILAGARPAMPPGARAPGQARRDEAADEGWRDGARGR